MCGVCWGCSGGVNPCYLLFYTTATPHSKNLFNFLPVFSPLLFPSLFLAMASELIISVFSVYHLSFFTTYSMYVFCLHSGQFSVLSPFTSSLCSLFTSSLTPTYPSLPCVHIYFNSHSFSSSLTPQLSYFPSPSIHLSLSHLMKAPGIGLIQWWSVLSVSLASFLSISPLILHLHVPPSPSTHESPPPLSL